MTWRDAMDRFGSDKPDVRFGMELVELTDVFADTGFNAFKAPCVKGIRHRGAAADTTRQPPRRPDRPAPSAGVRRASCGCASSSATAGE